LLGYISGKILEHAEGKLLVGVGAPELGGVVGYTVSIPESSGHIGLVPGQAVELYLYSHVREDAFDLYGFQTAAEKDLFLTFLSVSGIGPKGALNIMSGAEAGDIIQAILRADKAFLSRIPGIGKKTAERIVLELSDKIRKKMDAGFYASLRSASGPQAPAGASAHAIPAGAPGLYRDAISALTGLGFREADAEQTLRKIMDAAGDNPPTRVEDVIRMALRQM
jgi:Holliday junction DNA helicase RuvA